MALLLKPIQSFIKKVYAVLFREQLEHQIQLEKKLEVIASQMQILSDSLNFFGNKNEEIFTLQNTLTKGYENLNSLTLELQKRSYELTVLATGLHAKNDHLESMVTGLHIKNDRLDSLTTDLHIKNDRLDSLATELHVKNDRLDFLITGLYTKNDKLESMVTGLHIKNDELNPTVYDLHKKNDYLATLLSNLHIKLDAQSLKNTDTNAKLEHLKCHIDKIFLPDQPRINFTKNYESFQQYQRILKEILEESTNPRKILVLDSRFYFLEGLKSEFSCKFRLMGKEEFESESLISFFKELAQEKYDKIICLDDQLTDVFLSRLDLLEALALYTSHSAIFCTSGDLEKDHNRRISLHQSGFFVVREKYWTDSSESFIKGEFKVSCYGNWGTYNIRKSEPFPPKINNIVYECLRLPLIDHNDLTEVK